MTGLTRGGGQPGSVRRVKRATAGKPLAVDPEWLSATIGAIYDCAIQPANWRPTIEAITNRFEFAGAVLGLLQLAPDKHSLMIDTGIIEDSRARLDGYIADAIEMWGGHATLEAWPLEEPMVASQIIPLERMQRNRYYTDLLEPAGVGDLVVLPLVREPLMRGYLMFGRLISAGMASLETIDGLRFLAPHMRRAVTIGNLLDLKAVERATFESVLSAMAHGVVLVGEDLGIVHANPAASAILARGDVVIERHGKLVVRGPHAQMSLDAAVKWAALDESRIARRGMGVLAQGTNGEAAVLHVLPLNRGTIRPGMIQRAVAAVFLTVPHGTAHISLDAIMVLYQLTPAEGQIFASLAKGASLEATARSLGIAKSTARTHLLRIFEKTGCKRQAELVALSARHLSPV